MTEQEPTTQASIDITGVVLAGGLSRRMVSGDKALRDLGGRSLLQHVITRATPQVNQLILNTNSEAVSFSEYNLPIVPDQLKGYAGPLAGLSTAMEWSKSHRPGAEWLASFACDTPFFPMELVQRLHQAATQQKAQIALAKSADRSHPVFGLWSLSLADELRHAITDEGLRKVGEWVMRYSSVYVEFSTEPFDPFFNINTPADMATAEHLLNSQ